MDLPLRYDFLRGFESQMANCLLDSPSEMNYCCSGQVYTVAYFEKLWYNQCLAWYIRWYWDYLALLIEDPTCKPYQQGSLWLFGFAWDHSEFSARSSKVPQPWNCFWQAFTSSGNSSDNKLKHKWEGICLNQLICDEKQSAQSTASFRN